jgi:2-haloacid dehalogenase
MGGAVSNKVEAMETPRAITSAPLRAVLFDAYGTLFDVYSVGLLAEQLFPGKGHALGQPV